MSLNLNDCNPRLRDRILEQLRLETAPAPVWREADAGVPRLPPADPKPRQGTALVTLRKRKAASDKVDGKLYSIILTIYAVRPADYDGWDIKWLQDRIVEDGWLPDDNWRCLEGTVRSRKCTRAEERTECEIIRLK